MGRGNAPKRGRAVKTRPLRSDAQTKGMPTIALGKSSKKGKLKSVTAKKGKVKLKPVKAKQKAKADAKPEAKSEPKPLVDAEDSDNASVASARVRRGVVLDNDASTSKSSNEADIKSLKKQQKPPKAPADRSESPATTRLSRSSSASSFVGKSLDSKRAGKAVAEKKKGKSPATSPGNKTILNYFTRSTSPNSKGPTESSKKTVGASKKESESGGNVTKKGSVSTNSTPESVNSASSRSNQVASERSEINDDELSVLDDAESCLRSHSEDLDVPSTLNGVEDKNIKAIPKLTRKNINELFPSDDSMIRLRSGSPASQKSTRSLTLQRNSPRANSATCLRSATMSDSAVRLLRNGQQSKLKRSSLFESSSKKKKRVYAGALKDEDKIEDSRSDFSDEQSSIFSESDSSSFIDTFTRLKNTDMDDKMDVEDVRGSMSNDEDDAGIGQNGSAMEKKPTRTNPSAAMTPDIKADNLSVSGNPADFKDMEKNSPQLPKNIDILNYIQSDWDSDGEGNVQGNDDSLSVQGNDDCVPVQGKDDFVPVQENDDSVPDLHEEERSTIDELLSNTALPLQNDIDLSNENEVSDKMDVNDATSLDSRNFDDKQDSDSGSEAPSDSSKLDSINSDFDNLSSDLTECGNNQSKLPEPIVLKTAENKNCFAESVDFVAKKNPKIDFELLRRRTKRSMSFNTDAPERSQSQRILTVEPSKVHGKPALVWTVKAVRDPIIPKSTKSSEKKLSKSDAQENRNFSLVKPMMESTQNDQITAAPKVSPDAVLAPSQFSVNSSSVKENIMVQASPKQSPGKSPVRECTISVGSPKSVMVSPAKEVRNDISLNGGLDKEKSSNTSAKQCPQPAPRSPNDAAQKPSDSQEIVDTPATDVDTALKSPQESTPITVPSVAPSNIIAGEILEVGAPAIPLEENCAGKNPVERVESIETVSSIEVTKVRCVTPEVGPSAPQMDVNVTPDKNTLDEDSFCLRLSPTPTKEESALVGTIGTPKEHSSPKTLVSSSVEVNQSSAIEDVKSESPDPATKLPEEDMQIEKTLTQRNSNDRVPGKTESLQLIIKKGPSRPRSLSVDCHPSSLSFIDDVWIVKNSENLSTEKLLEQEENGSASVINEKLKENGDGVLQKDLQLEVGTISETNLNVSGTQSDKPGADINKIEGTLDVAPMRVKQPGLLSPRLEADVERLNLELNDIEKKRREITEEEQSPEKKAIKERILSSLGLLSVSAAAAAAASGVGRPSKRRSQDGLAPSSGRLKAVIKVPKDSKRDKKSDRKPLRMVFKNGRPHPGGLEDGQTLSRNLEVGLNPRLEVSTGLDVSSNSLFPGPDVTANGSIALLGDIPPTLQAVEADGKGKPGTNLVIPEKSSSFSIHPGRLCSDVCSYCFGKFGSLDTPCHVAQLKSRERQMKIMSVETHLALDSCLCDACIRYVDRKANCPSSKPQTSHRKDSKSKFEGSMATCSVTSCVQPARHSLRKKWYLKIRKSVIKKCPIDLELAHQHLPLPLCPEHMSYMEYFMACGLCKRRLSRNHMYNLTHTHEINICLEHDGIPARLSDKLFVCKLCRYYATLRLKHPGSQYNLTPNQREFFNSYMKRIMRSHDMDVSDGEEASQIISDPIAEVSISGEESATSGAASSSTLVSTGEENVPKGKRKRSGSNAVAPGEVDSAEQPKKKSRHGDLPGKPKEKIDSVKSTSRARSRERDTVPPVTISVSDINQATHGKVNKGGKTAKRQQDTEHAASMEMVRKGHAPFYPGEDELALHATFQFQFDDEPSGNRAWEKCTSTLQFDKDTKRLWQELQRPYGSQSSFLRHLVLMERYWREGELTLSSDASAKATSYTRSVQNRLKAYGAAITIKSAPGTAGPARPTQDQTAGPRPPQAPVALTPASSAQAPPKSNVSPNLTLTGDTVLTAAAAAAAVAAVHIAPLPSPSGEATSSVQSKLQPKAQVAKIQQGKVPVVKLSMGQVAQRKSQQDKAQQVKSHQGKIAQVKTQSSKPQASKSMSIHVKPVEILRKSHQPAVQVTQTSQQSLKSPQAITVTVKPPEPSPSKHPLPKSQVAISIASHTSKTISAPVSVASGVTITPELNLKTVLEKPQSASGKLQMIVPKPQSAAVASKSSNPSNPISRLNAWETSASPPTRPQFIPLSTAPVVNLTRSISLSAVPSTPSPVPDLHPINSQTSRPNRSPSSSVPLSVNSVSVTSSRGPAGSYVSIIPTSPSKVVHSAQSSLSLNKPASITPIYTSQPLPAPMSVTSSVTAGSSLSSPTVVGNETRVPNAGKVQVAAGGKFFYLTIPQFKKLQTLRQQRQQEQQKKLKAQAAKQEKEGRMSSTKTSPMVLKSDLEVVEVRDTDHEIQLSPLPTISAVCSGDQAKAMWNDESRSSDSDPSISISVAPPVMEISSIIGTKPDAPVEKLPKIPKTLTVTQIRKESPPHSRTVSASGISLTITRQMCQTPVAPQMSSPALDIFPS